MEVEEIQEAKAAHPEAEVLSHPECPAKVLELSDFVGSTSEIIAQAGKSDAKRIYHLYREWSSVRTSEEKPGEEILLYRDNSNLQKYEEGYT